ncbi:hypothetical protein Q5752_001564 [Cryptotrichosporon argae]
MMYAAVGLAALAALMPAARAVQLSTSELNKVYDVMNAICTQSWENGTKAEAILEWKYASLSVFSPADPIPLPSSLAAASIPEIMAIAHTTLDNRPATNTSAAARGGSPLLTDAAAGDPASLGITMLLADAASGGAQWNGISYGTAATDELNYLLYDVPRASNGAISHRTDEAQLWSDSVYMVPPFLAYYGALTANQTLVQAAYDQISFYRQALLQPTGLWQHIVYGSGTSDAGAWATGNAWAAAGIIRVLATLMRSDYADAMSDQRADLQNWAEGILGSAQSYITSSGLFHNYINDSSTFEDAASAALMSSVGLRLATLNLTDAYVDMSLTLLSAVGAHVNSSGYLTQVVNPKSFGEQGTASPEGQAFVLLAYSAFNEWEALGSPGNSSSSPLGKSGAAALGVSVGSLVAGIGTAVAWAVL